MLCLLRKAMRASVCFDVRQCGTPSKHSNENCRRVAENSISRTLSRFSAKEIPPFVRSNAIILGYTLKFHNRKIKQPRAKKRKELQCICDGHITCLQCFGNTAFERTTTSYDVAVHAFLSDAWEKHSLADPHTRPRCRHACIAQFVFCARQYLC